MCHVKTERDGEPCEQWMTLRSYPVSIEEFQADPSEGVFEHVLYERYSYQDESSGSCWIYKPVDESGSILVRLIELATQKEEG